MNSVRYQLIQETSEWIIVDKAAGVLTTPSRLGAQDPRPCLGRILENDRGERLWPVHRLDFETSGLVVFARTAEAHRKLSLEFENRMVKKIYRAETPAGTDLAEVIQRTSLFEDKLVRGKKRTFIAEHGKKSLTQVLSIQVHPHRSGVWCWTLKPLTGRPHQLRVQLASRGFPILGDALYGSKINWGADQIALRAFELEFFGIRSSVSPEIPIN